MDIRPLGLKICSNNLIKCTEQKKFWVCIKHVHIHVKLETLGNRLATHLSLMTDRLP